MAVWDWEISLLVLHLQYAIYYINDELLWGGGQILQLKNMQLLKTNTKVKPMMVKQFEVIFFPPSLFFSLTFWESRIFLRCTTFIRTILSCCLKIQYCTLATRKKKTSHAEAQMSDSEWTPKKSSSNFPIAYNYYVYILYITGGWATHLQIYTFWEVTTFASHRKPKVTHQWCKGLGKLFSGKKILTCLPKLRLHGKTVWVKREWPVKESVTLNIIES